MRLQPTPLLISLFLAACASAPVPNTAPETPVAAAQRRAEAPRPQYNLAGYPPAVRDGYIDGCETARGSEFGRKDERRIAADPQYKMGWGDGFAICGKK